MKEWTDIKRKLVAVCFLGLFLFVHLFKLSHHHTGTELDTGFATSQAVIKAEPCGVCDYHFNKDSDYTLVPVCPATPAQFAKPTFGFTSQVPSSIGISFGDRGPPVTG